MQAKQRGDVIRFVVSDDGPRIPPGRCEVVFKPFYQAPQRGTGAPGGTGLDLAIAQRIATLHGGRVWAESDGSHGTRVFIDLPVGAGG